MCTYNINYKNILFNFSNLNLLCVKFNRQIYSRYVIIRQ